VLHSAENTSAKTKPAEKLLALRKHASVINLESEKGFVTTRKKKRTKMRIKRTEISTKYHAKFYERNEMMQIVDCCLYRCTNLKRLRTLVTQH